MANRVFETPLSGLHNTVYRWGSLSSPYTLQPPYTNTTANPVDKTPPSALQSPIYSWDPLPPSYTLLSPSINTTANQPNNAPSSSPHRKTSRESFFREPYHPPPMNFFTADIKPLSLLLEGFDTPPQPDSNARLEREEFVPATAPSSNSNTNNDSPFEHSLISPKCPPTTSQPMSLHYNTSPHSRGHSQHPNWEEPQPMSLSYTTELYGKRHSREPGPEPPATVTHGISQVCSCHLRTEYAPHSELDTLDFCNDLCPWEDFVETSTKRRHRILPAPIPSNDLQQYPYQQATTIDLQPGNIEI